MDDEPMVEGTNPVLGRPLMAVDPAHDYQLIRMDANYRVFATLDAEMIDRIAERVAELLFERNRRGER